MANTYRGETPFRALGRDMFLVYRTQEVAEMQTAMGFRGETNVRPTTEEVPALNVTIEDGQLVHVLDVDGRSLAKLEDGKPKTRHVIVDAKEQQRRMIEAFDARMMSPLAGDLLLMIRCGLGPWERDNEKLSARQLEQLQEELGFVGLSQLHQRALENSYKTMLPVDESNERSKDPNGKSPESASQT